ncbi:MAG: hypothetical protein HY864_00265 [Chloroflexi bacterium]|nr:hypothetical protein [Chloroflexota bacterium]
MESQIVVPVMFFVISTTLAVWLFVQGCVNLKTGKKTKFGIDAFMYSIDARSRNFINQGLKARWTDVGRMRVMGMLALILAIAFTKTSIRIFLIYIK